VLQQLLWQMRCARHVTRACADQQWLDGGKQWAQVVVDWALRR